MVSRLWSLAGRRNYRQTHNIERTDTWVLNAHGMWMLLVGTALTLGAARDRSTDVELRALALGSAVGMALNDAVAAPAPIYRSDLIFEAVLAAAWPLAWKADP